MSTASEPIALFDLDATLANFEAAMNEQMSKLAPLLLFLQFSNCK